VGLLGAGPEPAGAGDAPPPGRRRSVGIQVGSVSFVDEGVEKVLEILQERGAVDTIYSSGPTPPGPPPAPTTILDP
jgi:hypothetical protein